MSFRDVDPMLQCLFYVNDLPGGERHHDGGMKGRDPRTVLANRMLALTAEERAAFERLRAEQQRIVVDHGAPGQGHAEPDAARRRRPGRWRCRRRAKRSAPAPAPKLAYAAVAAKYPNQCFFVSCDLDPSTKLGKATALVPKTHHFEMCIEEQAAALMADGLAYSSRKPQINVFATFSAFFEGIAREGFEMWRYQRNLNGLNEGPERDHAPLARRRVHRARSLLGLEPRLDQPGARLPAVPAPLLRAGRRARRLYRRQGRRRRLRRPHRRRSRATTCRC